MSPHEHLPAAPPPIPFTLRQLECFVAAAESGSIAGAAKALCASDSAVADAISAIERSLGTSLLHRRPSHGVVLTSEGRAILPLAHRLLSGAHELSAAVGQGDHALVGPVRVGALDTIAPVLIPRFIQRLAQCHPSLRPEIVTADFPVLLAALDTAELDVLLSFDIEAPPELQKRRLVSTQACLVVAAEHRLAGNPVASLRDVADEPMILLDILASRVHTLEVMSSQGITPRVRHRTSNYELCRSLVGQGLGYTLLMRRQINAETWDGGRVVFIPLDPPPRQVEVLALWREVATPRVKAVVDALEAVGREAQNS